MYIHEDIQDLAQPIDSLQPFPDNPRNGDVDKIRVSLRQNGQFRPIIVNRRAGGRYGDYTILAGNHTYMAAHEEYATEIAVTFVDVDDDKALDINLVDNKTGDEGKYDRGMLAKLLSSKGDLTPTGFEQWELEDMQEEIEDPPTLEELSQEYGEPEDSEYWPQIKVRVPPHAKELYDSLTEKASGDSEGDKFASVLSAVQASSIR